MGFLNIAGSYSGAGATEDRVFESNKRNFTPKIIKLRNHASTAIYTLANEINWGRNPNFIRLATENYEFARSLDSIHPIIANAGFGKGKVGDIEDEHDYTGRSEEHTSELQSLMRISYAVFCLKKKKKKQ